MSPTIRDAHMRMLSALPVRTHLRREYSAARYQGCRIGEIPRELFDEVVRLRAEGWRQKEIVAALRMGTKTYARILRLIAQPG